MSKFNRKKAIAALKSDDFVSSFERQLKPINTGWVIYWKGKAVKPDSANNHYFASHDAALTAISRNVKFGNDIHMKLAKDYLGLDMSDGEYPDECKAYREYFGMDLFYKKGKYINDDELTDEEVQIRNEKYDEQRKFDSFCSNALMTVFVKEWLSNGTLQIKQIK